MPAWRSHQRDVAGVVLSDDPVAARRIAARARGRIERALAVHRSTTMETLTATLAAAYPSVRRTLGAARFAAVAAAHVRARPPRRPDLWCYGDDFPDTLAASGSRATPVGLVDLARLDRAWREAFHAAEAPPLAPAALAARMVAGEPLRPIPHPSLRRLRLEAGNLARWRALGASPGHRDRDEAGSEGSDAIVVRPDAEIVVVALAAPTAALLDAILDGADLIAGFAAAAARHRGIDAESSLATLFGAGVFADRAAAVNPE